MAEQRQKALERHREQARAAGREPDEKNFDSHRPQANPFGDVDADDDAPRQPAAAGQGAPSPPAAAPVAPQNSEAGKNDAARGPAEQA